MIRRLNVKTLLELAFGLMLFFTLALGLVAYLDIKELWNFTDMMYQHPLQVSKASRDIKNESLSIESSMKSIGMDTNMTEKELDLEIQNVNQREKKILGCFKILDSKYLGPKVSIDSALHVFMLWKPLRDEIIASKKAGLEFNSYKNFKQNSVYRSKLFKHIDSIIAFSNNKADSLYFNAKKGLNTIILHYAIVFGVLFLLCAVIVYFLVRNITLPLKDLTKITAQYGQGNYDLRSDYKSVNEIGILAATFNHMASSIGEELSIKNEISKIAAILLDEMDIELFCRKLLDVMISVTESTTGAFYLADADNSEFALRRTGGATVDWCRMINPLDDHDCYNDIFQGEKFLHIKVSEESYTTGFTPDYQPKEIMCFPFFEDSRVIGAVILCSNTEFSSFALRLTKEIHFRLNANLNRVISFKKLNDFSARIDEQYRLLEMQSKEMESHSRELVEKNQDLKIAKERAELSDRLKTTFLLNMSHELRTPLNSVIGFSGILLQQLPGPLNEEQMKQIKMIQSSGCHLLSLINDILDISKIEAGELKPHLESFSVKDVIEEVIRMVWPFAANKNLPVHFINTPGIGNLKSDKKRVHQIILNIVNNAVKFTDAGSVNIYCSREDGYLRVEVADTGIGIKDEDLDLLFNPFVQLENNLTRKFEGSGLGLSISKKLMEMLQGKISVESEYGKGTRFILLFPA